MPYASLTALRPTRRLMCAFMATVTLAGCSELSYVQRNSPNNAYKDYRAENANNASVLGVGSPISERQMRANATISMQGNYDVEQVMQKLSTTYNLAVRWGNGVRKTKRVQMIMNQLTFDEARSYVEDVYDIQLIREGDRRLLVLPSASEPRLASFNPGDNITLASAIKGLGQQCGYNLVLTENKQDLSTIRVTTQLKDVTCFDAFEALLNPHGLSLLNTGDYYTIGGLPQRQWVLSLYEPDRSETSEVNLSTEFTADSGGSSGGGGGGTGGQSASGGNSVKIVYERSLWKDLQTDLQQLITSSCPAKLDPMAMGGMNGMPGMPGMNGEAVVLPPPTGSGTPDANLIAPNNFQSPPVNQAIMPGMDGGGDEERRCGYVRINPSVGTVQMRAPRSVLEEANTIIQRVQDIASRRILLEARVMAVTRTRGYDQRGRINIGNTNTAENKGNNIGFGGSITAALADRLSAFNETVIGSSTYPTASVAYSSQDLDVALSFVEQFGTTYTLMRPMMELMDRQRATLIDGTNRKYFIIQGESVTGTATTSSSSVEERNQFLGLQFSATAQIGDPGAPHTISLQIPITELAGEIQIPNPNNPEESSGLAPIVSTRLIDQKVVVRDGEIKVIGGLTKTLAVDAESGVPVLRDTAALGKLVNRENIRYENVEFVVLLQVRRLG